METPLECEQFTPRAGQQITFPFKTGSDCDLAARPPRKSPMLSFDTEPDVAPAPVIARVTAKQVIHSFQGKPKLNPYSEETRLMLAVRDNRDKRAFGKLFDHFGPRLKGVAMRSGLSSGQAEDMVQDVMLTLWRKAHLFDPTRAQVSSWLYQIARNRQIDILRKENRPMPEALKAESEATEESAADTLALDQEVSALKQALARLKPAQREMVEKAYLGELSHTDIEAETGLPLGTIKSRIRLGLEKLRHELDGIRKS